MGSANSMNWLITDRRDCTVATAKSATNPVGDRDFNSEVFVYSGHGYNGYAMYNHPGDILFAFESSDLPSMTNCELAVWDCCNSASDFVFPGTSLVAVSIYRGAKTVIGWKPTIYDGWSTKYMNKLFFHLFEGLSVNNASVQTFSDYDFTVSIEARSILDGLVIAGDINNIIYPKNTYSHIIKSAALPAPLIENGYELIGIYQNDCVELYAKTINGIMTDDFIIKYYRDGQCFKTQKSPYTLSVNDKNAALSKYNSINIDVSDKDNYYYIFSGGELKLVKQIIENDGVYQKISLRDCGTGQNIDLNKVGVI